MFKLLGAVEKLISALGADVDTYMFRTYVIEFYNSIYN